MATHSSILAWKIPRTEELGGLLTLGVTRIRHNLVTKHHRTHYFFQFSDEESDGKERL